MNKSTVALGLYGIAKRPARFTIAVILLAFTLSIVAAAYSAADIDIDRTALDAYRRDGENTVTYCLKPGDRTSDIVLMPVDAAEKIETDNTDFSFDRIYLYGDNSIREFYNSASGNFYQWFFSGYSTLSDADKYGFSFVSGRFPEADDEIAVPLYLYKTFEAFDYRLEDGACKGINSPEDLIGLTISLFSDAKPVKAFTIVGIIDTGLDLDKYALLKKDEADMTDEEYEESNALYYKLIGETRYSFHTAYFVTAEALEEIVKPAYAKYSNGILDPRIVDSFAVTSSYLSEKNLTITWKRGKAYLDGGEILLDKGKLNSYIISDNFVFDITDEQLDDYLNEGVYINVNLSGEYVDRNDFDSKGTVSEYRVAGYFEDGDEIYGNSPYIAFSDAAIAGVGHNVSDGIVSVSTILSGNDKKDIDLLSYDGTSYKDNKIFAVFSAYAQNLRDSEEFANNFTKVAFYVSLVFAAFSFFMMFNFISSSISARSAEIGVLRAMGAGKGMVAAVFSAESLITSLIASIISIGGAYGLVAGLNSLVKTMTFGLTMFFVSYRQILVEFALGILIGGLGSLIPILITTLGKKPVEILRK
jgi:ABC-type transport system, involved in lipoprotein release, permease component